MQRMIEAGMNIARLNFSHGDLATHKRVIENLRVAAAAVVRSIAIMADLSGPKIRIGKVTPEPIELVP
jgi:pyruvate kinase